jgi:hypothetical protein
VLAAANVVVDDSGVHRREPTGSGQRAPAK